MLVQVESCARSERHAHGGESRFGLQLNQESAGLARMRLLKFLVVALLAAAALTIGLVAVVGFAVGLLAYVVGRRIVRRIQGRGRATTPRSQVPTAEIPLRRDSDAADVIEVTATEIPVDSRGRR